MASKPTPDPRTSDGSETDKKLTVPQSHNSINGQKHFFGSQGDPGPYTDPKSNELSDSLPNVVGDLVNPMTEDGSQVPPDDKEMREHERKIHRQKTASQSVSLSCPVGKTASLDDQGKNQTIMSSCSGQQMTLKDMVQTSPKPKRDPLKKQIYPQSMLQHVLRGDSVVRTSPCAAIMSGVKNCGRTDNTSKLIHSAIKAFGNKVALGPRLEQSTEGHKDCLLLYKLIMIGDEPYDDLLWMDWGSKNDVAVMYLLSYFVNDCKVRSDDSYTKLEFTPEKTIPDFEQDPLKKMVFELHGEVKSIWEDFTTNKKHVLDRVPTGVSLVNVFDVGPSQAAQDFVPILNKYSRRSMHLTCYSDTLDQADLNKELDGTIKNSKSSQMFRQLKGCINEEQKVVVTRLQQGNPIPDTCTEKLEREIKDRVCTKNVNRVTISEDEEKIKKAIKFSEKQVIKSHFHCILYLREILLFHTIKKKCEGKSFWMKKNDFETCSKKFQMINGGLERFLRMFTSFGSIFYAHDIPALEKLVIIDIVKFVEYLHKIYTSREDELSQYGLFPYIDGDEDREICFKFLVALGIGVKVKSSQLESPPVAPRHSYYCYIPSTTQEDSATNPSPEDSVTITFDKCIAENIQACLCHGLLVQGARLKPTPTSDTTLCIDGLPEVTITDNGRDAIITMQCPHDVDVTKMYSRIFATYPYATKQSETHLCYQIKEVPSDLNKENFIEELQKIKQTKHCRDSFVIGPVLLATTAKRLSKKYSDNMETLFSVFNTSEEEQLKLKSRSFNPEITILSILMEFFYQSTHKEFKDALNALGISEVE